MENEKLMKTSRRIDRFLKILQGIMVAGMIVCVAFLAIIPFWGDKMAAASNTVSFGNLTLVLAPSAVPDVSKVRGSMILMAISAIVIVSAMWLMLRELRRIFVPLKDGHPFMTGISDRIRRMGWIVLIGGFVTELSSAIGQFAGLSGYSIAQMVNFETVASIRYDFEINGSFAIMAIVLFLLAHVFRYGEALQQESDETL